MVNLPIVVGLVLFLACTAFLLSEKGRHLRRLGRVLVTGLDSGFRIRQILFLVKIGTAAGLKDCSTLFWSSSALDKCTAEIVRQAKLTGTETDPETQRLLSSLYAYRRRMDLDQSRKKRGLTGTRDIAAGQRICIVLAGTGVFHSRVTANSPSFLTVEFPSSPTILATDIDWVYRDVKVFFWRIDDAGYEFSSRVLPAPSEDDNRAVLRLSHSETIRRSQLRKARRVKCRIPAQLYLLKDGSKRDGIESDPGMKCMLEDLSESGAMILIGGKAVKGLRLKLQFLIQDTLIIMTGVARGVEFDEKKNRSRLHFECDALDPRMRNVVLSFVYNVLPQEEPAVPSWLPDENAAPDFAPPEAEELPDFVPARGEGDGGTSPG